MTMYQLRMPLMAALAAVTALAGPGVAHAGKGTPVLPKGTLMRVQENSLGGPGWHEGKIDTDGAGCTMIFITKPQTKYTSVSLRIPGPIQMQKDGQWVDIPRAELVARMPAVCRTGDAD